MTGSLGKGPVLLVRCVLTRMALLRGGNPFPRASEVCLPPQALPRRPTLYFLAKEKPFGGNYLGLGASLVTEMGWVCGVTALPLGIWEGPRPQERKIQTNYLFIEAKTVAFPEWSDWPIPFPPAVPTARLIAGLRSILRGVLNIMPCFSTSLCQLSPSAPVRSGAGQGSSL